VEYAKFWENFGAVVKEGLCEGNAPRDKILDTCRFYSTANSLPIRGRAGGGATGGNDETTEAPHLTSPLKGEELVSLADYKSRMREGQEAIYCLTGDSLASLRNSPQIEGFKKRGIEVLLLTDHVDDFWLNVTVKYADLPFRSVTKAGEDLAKFPLDGEAEKEAEVQEKRADIDALCAAMKTLYGEAVREVRTTRKLGETPVCLSVGEGDMDMRMERFLMEHKQLPKRAAKIVEINPAHSVIQALSAKVAAGADVSDALWLLYDQALISEGEPVTDAAAFARRLGDFMRKGLVG
jgi:molecular chaperone HtpG